MKKQKVQKSNPSAFLLVASIILFGSVFAGVVFLLQNQDSLSRVKDTLFSFGKAKGLAVEVLVGSEKTSGIIEWSGGKLEAQSAVLTVPEKGFLSMSDVALYPIKEIRGLPAGASFISGVQIDSSESFLQNPATLTLDIPENLHGKHLRGFSYGENGGDFHFFPVEIRDNTAHFLLFHFSGYGIIAVDDPEMKLPEPSLDRLSAEFVIESIMKTYQDDFFWGRRDELPQGAKESLLTVMQEWFRDGVKQKLQSATGNDDLLVDAGTEYMVWRQMGLALGLEKELSDLDQEGVEILASAIKNGSDKAYQKCVNQKDATKAGRLLRIWMLVEALGLDGKAGINQSLIHSNTQKCARFELRISSDILENNECGNDRTKAQGTLSLDTDEALIIGGKGTVVTSEKTMCGALCSAGSPETYKVEVLDTQLAAGEDPQVSMLFKIYVSPEVEYACKPRENWDIGSTNVSWWLALMGELHFEDLVEEEAEYSIIKLTDWEIRNKDGVFAERIYQRSRPDGVGNEIEENTVFTLVHKPE